MKQPTKTKKQPYMDPIKPSIIEAAYRLGSYEAYLVMDREDIANKIKNKAEQLGDNWKEIQEMLNGGKH